MDFVHKLYCYLDSEDFGDNLCIVDNKDMCSLDMNMEDIADMLDNLDFANNLADTADRQEDTYNLGKSTVDIADMWDNMDFGDIAGNRVGMDMRDMCSSGMDKLDNWADIADLWDNSGSNMAMLETDCLHLNSYSTFTVYTLEIF